MRKAVIISLFVMFAVSFAGNGEAASLKMATTTSVEASGLLDVLLPAFEKDTGLTIHAIAVGTGKALKLAENGDVDLALVHAPELEKEFVENGFGVDRREIFRNDFVIAGPGNDPAGIKRVQGMDAGEVFRRIEAGELTFVSRGDRSGTHQKELGIWKQAQLIPVGRWYIETGQGMSATLNIANEKEGYCLVDRATFIAFQDKIDLAVTFEGDPVLKNIYSVIAVNPERHPYAKYKRAKMFIEWVSSGEGKGLVSGFRRNGRQLFFAIEEYDGLHF